MPRTRNAVDTVKLQLSTTPQVVKALETLATTGKFGKNASEAAEELLRLKLRGLQRDLRVPPRVPGARLLAFVALHRVTVPRLGVGRVTELHEDRPSLSRSGDRRGKETVRAI